MTDRERIAQHREEIPRKYRRIFDKAMRGRSMKSGIHSFCLYCFGWIKTETEHCTNVICPLYPYRPYQKQIEHRRVSCQTPTERGFGAVESTNSKQKL